MDKKIKVFAFMLISTMAFANGGKTAKANQTISADEITLINQPNQTNSEDDDFTSIRKRQYGSNQKQFYYFSKWPEYLAEVKAEKQRKADYEKQVAEYNSEVKRINAENAKIRAYNDSIESESENSSYEAQQGQSIDVSNLNQENVADSKKD